jgi:pseudaminic acid synthase
MGLCIEINGHKIGPGFPVYIIAELSANHCQDFDQAINLIKAAKTAGANAVKVQTYTPETLTLQSSKKPFHIQGTAWDGRRLYDLYEEASMDWAWQPKLKVEANQLGLDFFSTAFDPSAVDFLEEMNVPAHKVASFEIVDIPLVQRMAKTGKPLIISTGMATAEEIEEAVSAAREAGAKEIALLKCVSAYPASVSDMNLRSIPDLSARFGVPAGLSDHTLGGIVPMVAVAVGACIIEKHLTLSRAIKGPDSAFSSEPAEFTEMVQSIRTVEEALGQIVYGASESEVATKKFRRSLFVVKDVKAGEVFTEDNVRSIRPADGLPPKLMKELLGHRAKRDIEKGTPLEWSLIENTDN